MPIITLITAFLALPSIWVAALPSTNASSPSNYGTAPPSQQPRIQAIRHPYFGRRKVSYFVVDGLAVIDGDIIYGPVGDLLSPTAEEPADDKRALSVIAGTNTWPGANLRYQYESASVEKLLKPIVDPAIARWKVGAPFLKFTKLPSTNVATNGVVIIRAPVCGGCNANLGYANSTRNMNLQQSCPSAPNACGINEATHEFGHLLGLYHENQRPDREKYVHYNCANLNPACPAGKSMPAKTTCCDIGSFPSGCCGYAGNFGMVSGVDFDFSGPYDVQSIMHYRRDAFAKPGTATLEPAIPAVVVPSSNPSVPSVLDFRRICRLYPGQCPQAQECKSVGCPTSCVPTPSCSDPSVCSAANPPSCCEPTNCPSPLKTCTTLGCDFLKG